MTTPPLLACALAAALSAAPGLARAAGLKHLATITADDKDGPLRAPEGVACTDKGAIVVADTGNGRLLTYTWRDGRLSGGAPVKVAEATAPARVQIDAQGNVLALDRRTRRIVRVDVAGRFAGAVEPKGARGAAVSPLAFRVDAAGTLYVLDAAARRVVVAGRDGKVSRELPLPPGPPAFVDVAVDAAGRILLADPAGAQLWVAEKGAGAFKRLGAGLKDRLAFAAYVTDRGGRILVVDQHAHALVTLGADGSYQGRELEMGWTDGKVYYPTQACAVDGLVVVADRNNNRVQLFGEAR